MTMSKSRMYQLIIVIALVCCVSVYLLKTGTNEHRRTVYAVLPLTGSMSELGKTAKSAMDLYGRVITNSQLNVVYVDAESVPSKAISAVAQKTVGDKEPIVVTAFSFLANPVIGTVSERNGFSFAIATASVNSNLVNGTRAYQKVSTGVADVVTPIIMYANKRFKSAAVIYSSDEYGERNKKFFRDKFSGEVLIETPFHLSDPNVRELVSATLHSKPQMVFVTGSATVSYINLFKEMRSMKYNGQIMADLAFANPFAYTSLGEYSSGVIFSCTKSDFAEGTDEQGCRFRDLCAQNGVKPYFLTAQAYDALALIDFALRKNMDFTQSDFFRLETFSEGAETIRFTEPGECWYDCQLATVIGGKIVQLGD